MSSVYAVLWYICQEQLLAFSESRKLNGGTKRFPLSVNNLYYFIIFCKCPQFSFLLFLFTSLLFCPLHLVEGQFPIDSFSLSHFQQLLSASILVLVDRVYIIHLDTGFQHPKQPGPSMSATQSTSSLCPTPVYTACCCLVVKSCMTL